MVPLFGTQH